MAERYEIITKGEWMMVNRYRLYLKVLLVANISTGDGTAVKISFWQGNIKIGRSRDI